MAEYIEPMDYFPEEIRKQCKLGEYNEEVMKEVNGEKNEEEKPQDNEKDGE